MIGVTRSQDAPRILTEGTAADRYRSREVVERLEADFNGKCYICEVKPPLQTQVEHLRPHHNDTIPGRKFDWHNLFLACGHCNSVKNKAKYEEYVIDCCRRDPEALIEQELEGNKVHVGVLDKSDQEAVRTAELIEEVFMSDNPPLREIDAQARLEELQKCMNLLFRSIISYSANAEDVVAKRRLRAMLARDAKFAGFTRCFVRKNLQLFPGLAQYLE